ncbi:hypothetical protein GIB67_030886 [Kingdonia uniflora]|uniref:DNA endonuclease activator Ctp1 C-terminal domain-containing protein n=1 Tax=Kingdonia uniflora TaxID=39325 RepID=A0A7J7L3H2_9MAGN|nr:hypothetical protein GIB67_030886 [Kingdonia uniflora]
MEGKLQTPAHIGASTDNDDLLHCSSPSTILVASIQEVKDRVRQMEYIFCGEIFPDYRRAKDSQKSSERALKDVEDGWRKKESFLLLEIEKLRLEKQQALEQNQHLVASLEQEKEKWMNDARKTAEDDWRKKEMYLLRQIEGVQFENKRMLEENSNNELILNEFETEKSLLLLKLESLEKNGEVVELREQVKRMTEEADLRRKLLADLRQEIELKDYEITLERKKRKAVVETFKKVKSQYNFLCRKFGLTTESSPSSIMKEEERKISRLHQIPTLLPDPENKGRETSGNPSKPDKQNDDEIKVQDKLADNERTSVIQNLNSPLNIKSPPTSSSFHSLKYPEVLKPKQISGMKQPPSYWRDDEIDVQDKLEDNNIANAIENSNSLLNMKSPSTSNSSRLKYPEAVKSEQLSGVKRPASYWRDTRTRQEPGGKDPHDDFLDTPIDNAKGNLKKSLEGQNSSSDEETQDLSAEPPPQKQQISFRKPNDKVFKFVEPVRKKADREKLTGFECKQCKKFYDAVLPNGSKNGDNNNSSSFRCEHQDGVSRHRYRYVPPLTPEGFWNIGFESEM